MDFFGILFDMKNGSKVPYSKSYFDTLFAAKLAEMQIKTITGVLPLTFTAKGGTAVDWTIYGNDDNGTENLFDYSQGCDWALGSNGASYQKIIAQQGDVFTVTSSSALYALVRGYDANDAIISGSAWSTGGTSTYTAPASIAYVKVVFRNFEYSTITAEQKATINETMLVKGSTAPDHYIPYQQGVGENTEITGELPIDFRSNGDDLLGYKIYGTADEAGVQTENLVDVSASTLVPINTTDYRFGVSLGKLDAGNYVLSFVNNSAYTLYITKRTGTSYTQSSAILTSPFTFSVGDNVDEVYLRTTRTQAGSPSMWAEMGFTDIIINAGSTAPITYIPYGYQIPITISQTGQTVKTVNIYIGDSKLGEAEYVDYGEQKIYKRILFMTYDDKHFITKDNKDFCLRRRGYSG